jgi:hypothetical protein
MIAANLYFKPILGFAKGVCHDASIIDKGVQTAVVLLGKDLDKFLEIFSNASILPIRDYHAKDLEPVERRKDGVL